MSDGEAEPQNGSRYRMNRLESDIADIRGAILSLQSSVAALQIGLPDKFTPRTETVQAHTYLELRVDDNGKRLDQAEARFWQVVLGLLLSFVGVVVALVRTIPAPHGG